MSVQMAAPITPFVFPRDQEHEIVDAIHSSDKPLYIRSKGSDVHVGTKIVFEIQNENDIAKLQPLMKSISQSSSDVSAKNFITEIKGKQPVPNKLSITEDNNHVESDGTSYLQNSSSSFSTFATDSATPSEKSMTALPNKKLSENSQLLTPDFFQSFGKQFDNFKITDSSSKYPLETTTHSSPPNNYPALSYSENTPLKLTMPSQSAQRTEYYSHPPVVPYQQSSLTAAQNSPCFPTVYNSKDCSYFSLGSAHSSKESSFNSFTADTADSSCVPHPLTQSSCSPAMVFSTSPVHSLDNLPRVKLYDESPREQSKSERPNDYYICLNKNYMEERDFVLGIIPGVFYDTPSGILVEMINGSHYAITLTNKSHKDCDVDLYVDMELVYRIRLEAFTRSPPVDGPENSTKKFVFLRAFDAPPEANIINRHERNGQIKAVFKPKADQLEERRRAWSADAAVSCSQFLNQTIGTIMEPPLQRPLESQQPSLHAHERFRSGSLCSGATALQSRQREKYLQLAEFMKVDENRIVVLQLRLVARIDDQSRPNNNEPITPLITKMPPPLPF